MKHKGQKELLIHFTFPGNSTPLREVRAWTQKDQEPDWRDGSVVKSIACSSRGPGFNSRQPYGGSQPAVMRSGALSWPADIHTDKIFCMQTEYCGATARVRARESKAQARVAMKVTFQ